MPTFNFVQKTIYHFGSPADSINKFATCGLAIYLKSGATILPYSVTDLPVDLMGVRVSQIWGDRGKDREYPFSTYRYLTKTLSSSSWSSLENLVENFWIREDVELYRLETLAGLIETMPANTQRLKTIKL
jgi:hypothetical protein